MRDSVDGSIVEGDAAEQQEHAEADHDDGQPPITGDVYSHVVPKQRQCYGDAGVQQEKIEPDAGRQPDLLGGERFHIPLISRNQNEQVDESEETIINFYHSGDETGQSPYDQYDRGQRKVVFAAERLQSLGQEGEERQEYGVGGGVPPYAHAQRHDAFHHEFHTEIGSVEHEVERYEDKAPEQELAFHDPYALQVGFDGLFLVEEEPCGDGEEDDDADLAAAGHDELEGDPFRSQGEFQHVIAVMDDKMTHQNHEHRDDAQQFDAGIPLPITMFGRPRWSGPGRRFRYDFPALSSMIRGCCRRERGRPMTADRNQAGYTDASGAHGAGLVVMWVRRGRPDSSEPAATGKPS